jgi:hypothetical protein
MSQVKKKRNIRFTIEEAQQAAERWNFNCGPAAICAVLKMTPKELRPHMLDFEQKGYTNPTLMLDVLKKLGAQYRVTYRGDEPINFKVGSVMFGLMRVQWAGAWTKPNVPMRARYRQTHWVAVAGSEVFDVNAMCVGGWLPYEEWSLQLVPWLIRECCPKGNGDWWPTHILEVVPKLTHKLPLL